MMARYRDAIDWIAREDDTEWLENGEDAPSVTASLVADLFGRTDDEVRADIKKAIKREEMRRGRPLRGVTLPHAHGVA